jgi:hypothetical protein
MEGNTMSDRISLDSLDLTGKETRPVDTRTNIGAELVSLLKSDEAGAGFKWTSAQLKSARQYAHDNGLNCTIEAVGSMVTRTQKVGSKGTLAEVTRFVREYVLVMKSDDPYIDRAIASGAAIEDEADEDEDSTEA